jgi:hypothetical protein
VKDVAAAAICRRASHRLRERRRSRRNVRARRAAVVPLAGRRTAKRTLQVAAPATGAVERDTVKLVCTAN